MILLLACALFQDPAQDPASGWKTFAIGSWVRVRTVTKLDAKNETRSESKLTLVERTKDSLILEQETTIQRETRKDRVVMPLKPPSGTVLKVRELSRAEEEVVIGGRTLKCLRVENEVEATQGGVTAKSVTRMWLAPEIPGGLARMRVKVLSPNPLEVELDVAEYEKK